MTNQFIHGTITTNANVVCAITAVYASNSHTERQTLWKNIQDLAGSINIPWAVLGDFNCCRELGEKVGGTALTVSKLGDFNTMVFNAGIHDLSSVGHFFTWHNQQIHNPIHIKLDRVLVNDTWLNCFPNSFYKVEDPDSSDHSPLILIIHPNQGGFIHKRIISDHILLATDILGSFNLKAKNKYLCAKFDITKAFDMVSRDFLYKRLKDKGFPDMFISWIKACTTNVHFSICINGVLEGYFNSTSGIRQGCPLSPYLFAIIMDGLSSLFDLATANNSFQAIKAGRCEVSHLMFADDLLVFSTATTTNAHAINSILKDFAAVSGLTVNPLKSSILLSNNTLVADEICHILNIQQATSPIKYLGLPIFYRKLRLNDFNPLIQKITSQLEGWKARLLSLAGRVQFIKFTISNTLAYWIRGSIIPKGCCKLISRLCSRFTFFGNIKDRKLATISWSKTCCPKIFGGLGIPSISSLQHSYACSAIWRFLNADSLLISWWRAKYNSFWKPKANNNSYYWNYLCTKANEIKDCITFTIHASSNLSFFWDPWCGGNSVANYLMSPNTVNYAPLYDCKVSQLILGNSWNLPSSLDSRMVTLIQSVPINSTTENNLWNNKQHPTFRDFNSQLYANFNAVPWHKYIWHKHNALRYSVYAWMMFHGGLKTADVLAVRGIFVPNSCCFCNNEMESITHLFFECSYTFEILKDIFPWMHCLFMRSNYHQVFDNIWEQGHIAKTRNLFLLYATATIYFVWRARNDRLFGGIIDSKDTIIAKIKKAVMFKSMKWQY
ncbi:Putative ribonuclease H protein [Dendrobium catenatum]|uniref:Ribonuclease H protein n=1 Tax=Dendrobium catenatum TaxID=906689 RepID=A0A2I0WSC6_9ASPA|nr:Putative ribonuclease H protein [Dendrobium catenatum]